MNKNSSAAVNEKYMALVSKTTAQDQTKWVISGGRPVVIEEARSDRQPYVPALVIPDFFDNVVLAMEAARKAVSENPYLRFGSMGTYPYALQVSAAHKRLGDGTYARLSL